MGTETRERSGSLADGVAEETPERPHRVFDHERLEVYQQSLDFVARAHRIAAELPRGRRHLADQLTRAASSIVLNIAEGAGRFAAADKRHFYLIARGSTTEAASALDIGVALGLIRMEDARDAKLTLVRVTEMLVKIAKSLERRTSVASSNPAE